jgi:outer membrane protein TolC
MSRPIFRWAAIIQIGLVLFTGCQPMQPFFVGHDASMAHYLEQSMGIEYADVHVESLPEATQSHIPLGPTNVPSEFVDLTLEDCIAMALQNTKIVRVVNVASSQSGSVAAALISAAPGQLPSIYDPALVATTANTQPLTIDSQGNRIAPRGYIRANQIGGVEDALSDFDAQFSALFGYNTTDRPRNVARDNPLNNQEFQAVDSNAQAALSKRMATGTIASARFTTVYSRNNIPAPGIGRIVPSDYTAALELQVTQPLLRGRGTLINRIPVVLARINEDIQLHEFEGNIRNLVKSVEDAYWDLYCGYRAFETAQTARASALDLWRVAAARNRIGAEDSGPEAEAQARASYKQFESQIHTSLYGSPIVGNDPRGLYGREQVLREKIGWPASDSRLIRPADEPTEARVQFDWSDVTGEALMRNVELRRQKWAIKQRELELIAAKNNILPQLDVTAFYRWLGVGDEFAKSYRTGLPFPDVGSTALESLTGGDYQELGARLELTPQAIGKRRALANIQNGHIQLKKSQEELREKEIMLINELSFAWRNMESTYLSIKDFRDQWQANTDEIKVYNDRIGKVGVLNQQLDLLLRAEERRARSQLQYYQAVCEYNKAMVSIHYWKGSLLDLNNIALGEGAWVDKAYWDAEGRAKERAAGIYFDYGYTRPAVVSNGPVAMGGRTEGNFSDNDSNPDADLQGEPVPAEELNDTEQDVRPELLPPTAGSQPGRSRGDVVRQQTPSDSFDWGGIGIGSEDSRPVVVTSSGRQRISDSSKSSRPAAGPGSSGTTNRSSDPWKPRS